MVVKYRQRTKPAPSIPAVEREKAKRILVEIIRQSGGTFTLKTNLYKAFYHAHLRYAETSPGYLSKWPIVRMPRGPGIHRADQLLSELVSDGILQVEDPEEFEGFSFALTKKANTLPPMQREEIRAIRYGVKCVSGKSAKQVSDESHSTSRSWNSASDGEELNIYADMSDTQTHKKRVKFFSRLDPVIAKAFGDQLS